MFRVEYGTPVYMVREKLQRDKFRRRMRRRTWGYEKWLVKGNRGKNSKKVIEENQSKDNKKEGVAMCGGRDKRLFF